MNTLLLHGRRSLRPAALFLVRLFASTWPEQFLVTPEHG